MKTPYILFLSSAISITTLTHAQDLKISPVDSAVTKLSPLTQNNLVKGKVISEKGGAALEMCNVVLTNVTTKKQYYGFTDEQGDFEIPVGDFGKYNLAVMLVSYQNNNQEIDVNANSLDVNTITLKNIGNQLAEVTITDMRKIIERRPDGIVYDVENDKTAAGTMAVDLLKKVPFVTVDLDGNVQLRGNSSVKVLIDGKPSTIIASNVKDALKQIPSDNIKSIEVITNPGAKYEGEGVAGVINIITKKKKIQGFSGNIYGSPYFNFKNSYVTGYLGGGINYKKGKFGIGFNIGGGSWKMFMDSKTLRTDFLANNETASMRQSMNIYGNGQYTWSNLNVDYQIDSNQSIQVGANFNLGAWKQDIGNETTLDKPQTYYYRQNHSTTPSNNMGFNAAYTKKFAKNPEQTLQLLSQYTLSPNKAHYHLDDTKVAGGAPTYFETNINKTKNSEFAIQADYSMPLSKKYKLELGSKYINRDINSNYQLDYLNSGVNNSFVNDPNRTNELSYTQNVFALYGQVTGNLTSKLSTIAGLRYEHTDIDGNLLKNGGDFNIKPFNNFLPNIIFTYDLKGYSKLKLAYNARINRPSLEFVNPYINYSDPYTLTQGNPTLNPEISNNYELGYSNFFKGYTLNAALFSRNTNHTIESITNVDNNGVSLTTFQNIAKRNDLGVNLFASKTFGGKVMVNLTSNVFYNQFKNNATGAERSGWATNSNIYTNYAINKKYSLSAFIMYISPTYSLQGTTAGYYYYNLALQRKILNDKGTLTLASDNPFGNIIKLKNEFDYQNAHFVSTTNYYAGSVRLSFTYNFGKIQFVNNKKMQNDDLKEGTSNGMMKGNKM